MQVASVIGPLIPGDQLKECYETIIISISNSNCNCYNFPWARISAKHANVKPFNLDTMVPSTQIWTPNLVFSPRPPAVVLHLLNQMSGKRRRYRRKPEHIWTRLTERTRGPFITTFSILQPIWAYPANFNVCLLHVYYIFIHMYLIFAVNMLTVSVSV